MGRGKSQLWQYKTVEAKCASTVFRWETGSWPFKVQNMWIIPELAFKLNFLAAPGKSHADYSYDELLTGLVLIEVKII